MSSAECVSADDQLLQSMNCPQGLWLPSWPHGVSGLEVVLKFTWLKFSPLAGLLYTTPCAGSQLGGERGRAGGERGKPLLADGWDRELRVSQDRSFHFLLSVILRKVFLLTRFL